MNKEEIKRSYFYKGVTAFCVFAVCAVFFFLIYRIDSIWKFAKQIISVMQPIIFGFVIAYLVNPIVNFFNSKLKPFFANRCKNKERSSKVANIISVGISLAIFIIIIFAVVYLVIPQFVTSISNVITVLPGQIDLFITKSMEYVKSDERIEEALVTALEYGKNWLQTDLAVYVSKVASNFANGVWSVITFLKNFFIGIMIAMYLLADKARHARRFRKFAYAVFNEKTVAKILRVLGRSHTVFSGFINGKLLDSLIIGILCFIGVTALKIPYTMLVAVIVGVTNVIPVFGPYIGAIPCAALILLTEPIKGLYFIIFIILLQALDGNVIGPKILGNKTGLETFWVVFAIVVGGGMFGIVGMLIGVPSFAVIYYIIRTLVNNRLRKKQLPIDSGSYTGIINGEIRDGGSVSDGGGNQNA